MPRLTHIRVRCDGCRALGDLESIDGVIFHPPSWTDVTIDGIARSFCSACVALGSSKKKKTIPEAVRERAAAAVFALQSLIATELMAQNKAGLVVGDDGAARRMKRVEILAQRAAGLSAIYGIPFRQGAPGVFEHKTLAQCVGALEELLRAEIVFPSESAEDAAPRMKASIRGNPSYGDAEEYTYNGERKQYHVDGYFERVQQVARLAMKLATLAAVRAGEVLGNTREDEELDTAFDDNLFRGRGMANQPTPQESMVRQLTAMFDKLIEVQTKQEDRREAQFAAAPTASIFTRDPVRELQELLDVRERLVQAGRDVAAIDARIAVAEVRLAGGADAPAVAGSLFAEAAARDVTPKRLGVEHEFQGAPGAHDAPPDADELEHLRSTLGDDAVKKAFPEAFARADALRDARDGILQPCRHCGRSDGQHDRSDCVSLESGAST